MKTIQVYDKPMCCSTGVCGPQVDPVLPRFAADLEWLKSLGYHVERGFGRRSNQAQMCSLYISNRCGAIQHPIAVLVFQRDVGSVDFGKPPAAGTKVSTAITAALAPPLSHDASPM